MVSQPNQNPESVQGAPNTTLTAIPGFRVGHWTHPGGRTGCTVILCPPEGAIASASFMGPAPGTREGVMMAPEKKVEHVHALLLTGGSAFGLAAATGVMRWLEERGIGRETPLTRVPIVPAAVIYDLMVGDPTARPDDSAGYAATDAANGDPVAQGRVGAGAGATAGKYLGIERASPGGLGSALAERAGVRVAALAVVNPVGDVIGPDNQVLAGPGVGPGPHAEEYTPDAANTTLLAVVTDRQLTKADARRLADAAQAALGRVLRPSHTYFDGDSAFVLSSNHAGPADPVLLTYLVQQAVAHAVWNAVLPPDERR